MSYIQELNAPLEAQSYKIQPGYPLPFGATPLPGGVNFSVFSRFATACTLVLFKMIWVKQFDVDNPAQHRAQIVKADFDWGYDRPLLRPDGFGQLQRQA